MKVCLICGVCGGKNPACRPEDVIDVPDPIAPPEHPLRRAIRLSTLDLRRKRAEERRA